MNPTMRIAENHTRISRAFFYEGMRAVENKDYAKIVRKLGIFLIIIFAAAAAWLLYIGGSLIFLLGEAVFLGALFFWLTVMLPNTRRRRKYKAMMQGTDNIPERNIVFYQKHLSVTADSGKETVIQYDDIIDLQETKNLYILNCKKNVSVLLDKKGFVTGDFDTVKSHIQA